MTTAIMQPYLFPYIGYFQLVNAADKFVVYDNIQFTKKGWINRNRILVNGKDEYISFPLKKDSDFLNIKERYLADCFEEEAKKLLRKIEGAYRKAPQFENIFFLLKDIIKYEGINLFDYIFNSLKTLCDHLSVRTEFIVSSSLNIDHTLRGQDKVIAICKATGADQYINPVGGTELYSKGDFKKQNIALGFIKSNPIVYNQFGGEFVPWLSIIDVLMFNDNEKLQAYLQAYSIV